MTDISNYKIKVVAGIATIEKSGDNLTKYQELTKNYEYEKFQHFAAENTFKTDKSVPDGVYDSSMFGEKIKQRFDHGFHDWTKCEGEQEPGTLVRDYRPFLGTPKPIETENESVEQAADKYRQSIKGDIAPIGYYNEPGYNGFIAGANWMANRIGPLRNDEVDRIRKQAMHEQREMLQEEWVSVEDRLPDNINIIDYVLVIIEGQKIPEIAYWNNEHKWWVTRQNHSAGKEIDKVIYWRALPPAPQSQRRIK